MAITQVITTLPEWPSRSNPENFNTKAEAYLAAMEGHPGEMNTWKDQANLTAAQVSANAAAVAAAAPVVNSQYLATQIAAQDARAASFSAIASKTDAEQSALAAAGYASQAQATNPDTPIRINPNAISADFTIATGYNGVSAGPIRINAGVQVTVARNSHWSIV